MIIAAVVWCIPNAQELVENKGQLRLFYILHQSNLPWFPGKSKTWYDTVWYTTDGGRYFSDSLYEEVAKSALRVGSTIIFYTKPGQKPHTLENGEKAVPSYGLSIDGREIQSPTAALGWERSLVRFAFPVIGVGFIGLAFLAFRQNSRRALTSPNQSLQPTADRRE